ncbi:MAG: glycoside hydrolase family 97 C-terminal domain-containing protein, partial [Bacteroidales bacterium]|nr:glycoside hydrolase family 97 C-terminal domain-containing protein [Bacteroidales bacterium]
MVAGPVDYTQGAMRNATKKSYVPNNAEPMSEGTRCRQLAEYVIFLSPLNMLCDSPSNYLKEEECVKFIADCPETWDETVAIDGKIGEYIVVARRKGNTWHIGAITDWKSRDITIRTDFLPEGSFTMDIFEDGPNAEKAARDYAHRTASINGGETIRIHLAPGGGWAAALSRQ